MFKGNVLALDLASTSGWAHGKPGSVPRFGHQRFAKQGEPRGAAYHRMRLWLDLFCSAHRVDWVVFEAPIAPLLMTGRTNINTIRLLVGFAENLEAWCYRKVEIREARVSEIRAAFLGSNYKTSIAKPMTMDRCHALGWMCETSDEADACAAWSFQCALLRPDLAHMTLPLYGKRPIIVR